MRIGLVLIPLSICAAPALAQPTAPLPARPQVQVPAELSDPVTARHMVDALQVLSKAFLDMPVGEVRAAMEGRRPTAADRAATVRSETRMTEQQLRAKIEAARPMLERSTKALAEALPSLMQNMAGFEQSLERAAANMPDPNYPKR